MMLVQAEILVVVHRPLGDGQILYRVKLLPQRAAGRRVATLATGMLLPEAIIISVFEAAVAALNIPISPSGCKAP